MGHKTRAYKHRLDKYYHLARSVGYRSRAAFKLIQLNQQYDFLSTAGVCLDLCAAPGGWSQVAAKYMPVGSMIIGIDLAPIKPIPNVMTLQADITSPKTHARVRKMIQGNRADVILNDGAPNVGAAWITDSTNQLDLCLASLKFATLFLRKGGTFVTKVFRSEHYNALIWVLERFFEKVISTKPKASRDTSAEFFIVARNYKAPTDVDPRLLDSQYVFTDFEELMNTDKVPVETRVKTSMEFSSCTVSDFIKTSEAKAILATVNQIEFDQGPLAVAAAAHPATNPEIREYLNDLKVISRADWKVILKWRKVMREALIAGAEVEPEQEEKEAGNEEDDDLDDELKAKLNEVKMKQRKREKSEAKHRMKMREQLLKRLQKNSRNPSATADMLDPEVRYGKLNTPFIQSDDTSGKTYEQLVEENLEYIESKGFGKRATDMDDDGETIIPVKFARHVEIPEEELTGDKATKMWFQQSIFQDDSDEDSSDSDDEEEKGLKGVLQSDSDYSEDEEAAEGKAEEVEETPETAEIKEKAAAAAEQLRGQSIKNFDATAYSIAKRVLTGNAHTGREIIDDSFNRYLHDDGELPQWFVEDEKYHNRPMTPVSKDDVAEWRQRMRDINEVSTKRVVEARARKKQKALLKMKSLQEKASEIADKEGLNERSKLRIMERIYNRGMSKLDSEPKIVVAQKRDGGKVKIPNSAKGKKVRVVDPRFKKDLRGQKNAANRPQGVARKKKSKYIHRRK